MNKTKLYCFIDESGQDTKGRIFVVAVVITDKEKEHMLSLCEQLEKLSGKRKDKWGEADHEARMRYIRHIFADDRLKNCLRYEIFRNTVDYDTSTIDAIASAVKWGEPKNNYTTLIYVDGLRKTKRHEYGAKLRKLGIPTRKVQGVPKDEANALTRLADAIAGFVHDALDDKSEEIRTVFKKAKKDEMLIEVTP